MAEQSQVDVKQIKEWFTQFKSVSQKGPQGEVISLFLETIDHMLQQLNMSPESDEAYQVKWQLLQALLLELTADFWKTIGVERFSEEVKPYLSEDRPVKEMQEKILEILANYSKEYNRKKNEAIWEAMREIGVKVLNSFVDNLGTAISEQQRQALLDLVAQYKDYELSVSDKGENKAVA